MIGGSSASGKYSEYFVSWGSCAATLIYPDVALTAAHCSMKDVANVGGPDGQTTSVVSKTNHPDKKLDLAVLQLGGWFGDISTVTLNNSDSNPSSSTLTLVGVGSGRSLVQGNVQFVEPDVCNDMWSEEGFSIDADSMICAGSFTTSTSSSSGGEERQDSVRACPGDSGSPLLDSSGVQVGVVSSGPQSCQSSSLPVVYARVSAGFDWIAGNICSESKLPPWWCKGSSSGEGTTVRVDIVYDRNPEDIEWSIEDGITGQKVAESEFERIESSHISTFVELPDSAYVWVLKDSFGDGFKGRYQVVEVDRDGEDRSILVSGDADLDEDIVEVRFVIGGGFEEFLNPPATETNETPAVVEQPDSETGGSDDDEREETDEDDDVIEEETEAPTEAPEEDDELSAEDDDDDRRFLRHRRLDEDGGDDDDDEDDTNNPTVSPAPSVSMYPSSVPSTKLMEDTQTPSVSPTDIVTPSPSIETTSPTLSPTQGTPIPTSMPSEDTPSPSLSTPSPTMGPSQGTPSPTSSVSGGPSEETQIPTISLTLSSSPTQSPSESTASPTDETSTLSPLDGSLSPSPTEEETVSPSGETTTFSPDSTGPTATPSPSSSATATSLPTGLLTESPTAIPSDSDTTVSLFPTVLESETPSSSPTVLSTDSFPPTTSQSPSGTPTQEPATENPSTVPSSSQSPSVNPTKEPTTVNPSAAPSTSPTELFVTFLLGVNLDITAGPSSISWRIRDEDSGRQVIGYREGWYTITGQQFVGPVILRNGRYEFELERSDVDAGATINFFEVDILTGGTKPIDALVLDGQDDATLVTVSFELTL